MKIKHLYISAIVLLIFQVVASGQEVQEYLNKVRENNPEIIAYRKLLDARKNAFVQPLVIPRVEQGLGERVHAVRALGSAHSRTHR